jgi:hypothetical protein
MGVLAKFGLHNNGFSGKNTNFFRPKIGDDRRKLLPLTSTPSNLALNTVFQNTVPEQTRAHEEHLLIAQQQQLEQLKQQQIIQFRIQEQEIEAARHFGRL